MARKAIYSRNLGIDLRTGRERELFKWFLACLLFGKPIQQEVAALDLKQPEDSAAAVEPVEPRLPGGADRLPGRRPAPRWRGRRGA
ncbi:MAG: hypothetical protein HY725_08855 [Candidatus Rokubacteria bacterium]|nr:hypothetical protein [Candidatus Rokubacteria bacterium]